MIRLFKVYYPVRTLVLLGGEALIVWFSFVLGTMLQSPEHSWLIEGGYVRILGLTGIVLLLSHGFGLYDSTRLGARLDQASRLLCVLGLVALALGGILYVFPGFLPRNSALSGVLILTIALFCWQVITTRPARRDLGPESRERQK